MEIKKRYVIRRIDGKYMNLRFEPTSLSLAGRFSDLEGYSAFMHSYYRPSNPDLYQPIEIEIIYREVAHDEGGTVSEDG